jgi:hypothetical protein
VSSERYDMGFEKVDGGFKNERIVEAMILVSYQYYLRNSTP